MTINIPEGSGPLALIGTARPLPGRETELRTLLLSFVEPTRRESGCLQYLINVRGEELVFYERWRTPDDLRRHLELPHMQAFLQQRMDYLASDLQIEWLLPLEPGTGAEDAGLLPA